MPARRERIARTNRAADLESGIVPSASGSAYLELVPRGGGGSSGALKLVCAVHGPKPLPRSAPFSPHLALSATVRMAPFATRARRGPTRDAGAVAAERDLAVHLETALRGVLMGERWPKSGLDVVVTVLESDEDVVWGRGGAPEPDASADYGGVAAGWGALNVLAGCVTVASAAIAEAGVDCIDMVSGGVAALVRDGDSTAMVLDPCPAEHDDIFAACAVAYLSARDEITELWCRGSLEESPEKLIDKATEAAAAAVTVLEDVTREGLETKFRLGPKQACDMGDVEMQDVGNERR